MATKKIGFGLRKKNNIASGGGGGGSLPVNTVAPVASGTNEVGETLSCTDGTWTGYPAPSFTYQWRSDTVDISGATSSTYVLQSAEAETDVDCVVTATNYTGSASADSNDITIAAESSLAYGDTNGGSTNNPSVTSGAVTGNTLTITNQSYHTALSSTTLAILDGLDLKTLSWDGTDWSQVGNTLSGAVSGNSGNELCTLDENEIAVIRATENNIIVYAWDGTDWSQVGNTFTTTGTPYADITSLDTDKVAYLDNGTLQALSWDGTDFSTLGNSLGSLGHANSSLTALDDTTVVIFDPADDDLITYSFDGSDWSASGNAFTSYTVANGSYGIQSLSTTRISFVIDTINTIKVLDWDGTDWSETLSFTITAGILSSWPRNISRMSDTQLAVNGWGGAKLAFVTLS